MAKSMALRSKMKYGGAGIKAAKQMKGCSIAKAMKGK